MTVESLMSKNLIVVHPESTVAEAAQLMMKNHVSGLPVLDADGKLVGMVTEGDLLRRAEIGTDGEQMSWLKRFLMPSRLAEDYVVTHGRHVEDVMTRDAVVVAPGTSLTQVAQLMLQRRLKRLPVVKNGILVGIVARSDLLRALAEKIPSAAIICSDAAIGDAIKAELDRASWAPKSGIKINVNEQIVDLEGTIFSDEERRAVLVIVENTPGVRGVQDHLMFVDPTTGMAFPGV